MPTIDFSCFNRLNKEQELQRLNKIQQFYKSLKINIKDLEDHLFYILQNSLNELSH